MNTITRSAQRSLLEDELLPFWGKLFKPGSLIYDIGANPELDYSKYFPLCMYKTIDRDRFKSPHIVMNLEYGTPNKFADGIIFNGVFEQCDNPFALIDNIRLMLKPKGRILVGLAGIGMLPYGENDKWRVTRCGAIAYLESFEIITVRELPEYFFIIGRLR